MSDPVIDTDEFADALEDGSPEDRTFEVSPEELSIIRGELACNFPEDFNYLSDAYILSVASKPYSKDPTIRRPLDYTMEKLSAVMEWRQESGAPDMESLIELANGPDSSPEALDDPDRYAKAKAMANSLNYAAMYWHGVDKEGRPILWIRCNRMPWFPDVQAQVNSLILLADAGIKAMPPGMTDFIVLSDSNSPPPPNPQFMISLLSALVKGYPDRLHLLVSVPVGSIIQFIMQILLPLMPGRLAQKIVLLGQEESKDKLSSILYNGEADIPTFVGGKCDHEEFYPLEGKNKSKGGNLKFDYFGMKQRLQDTAKQFMERKEG